MLLSVKPCCTDTNCDADVRIGKVENSAPTDQDDRAGCPPFFACNGCVGFVPGKPLAYALFFFPEPILKHNSVYVQPLAEDVTLAIWQPPQIG
ncbi:hypothetical protein [Mucilaginibacter myungsuensis]|uniref:Uncharacterized protein n=1 Tax=Mucilaginibacter myungsuensis TaxID=649104 RepID=A0A929PVI5_9SPHI|nr:hypothetical protein [Mucilaginibacter myungsuensis]MBE9661818.1 hypothetical protein [Mucilaginibacter myungsuensis]MDN3599748.1 hypothetical protein [Mucilaginibacter myungsuensis]